MEQTIRIVIIFIIRDGGDSTSFLSGTQGVPMAWLYIEFERWLLVTGVLLLGITNWIHYSVDIFHTFELYDGGNEFSRRHQVFNCTSISRSRSLGGVQKVILGWGYDWIQLEVLSTGLDSRADERSTYFFTSIISYDFECHPMTNVF